MGVWPDATTAPYGPAFLRLYSAPADVLHLSRVCSYQGSDLIVFVLEINFYVHFFSTWSKGEGGSKNFSN